jgi:hypothetical protein
MTTNTETRLAKIERMLMSITSKLGIVGIDHRPAPLPKLHTSARVAHTGNTLSAQGRSDAYRAGRKAERQRIQALLSAPEAARNPALTLEAYVALHGDSVAALRLVQQVARPLTRQHAPAPRKLTAADVMRAAETVRKMRDGR